MAPRTDLESWMKRQAQHSALAMEKAISATSLVRRREAFGQEIRPVPGSVLASPEIADWDPEPDYFFHWLRDSAIVMRTVAELMEDAHDAAERQRWQGHFDAFIGFSLALADLDGRTFLATSSHSRDTPPDARQYLRPDSEIRALVGDALLGEPRFNPDGTIDVFRWSRPQYDGPALRALACLRYLDAGGPQSDPLERLLRLDLDFTRRHADLACIGPWEEPGQVAHHYPVALVQLGALVHGRGRLGDDTDGAVWAAAEDSLRAGLARHWSERHGIYAAIRDTQAESPEDLLDAAMLIAVLDADLPAGPHGVRDPRVRATLAAIEKLFAGEFPINRTRPPGRGPALGRYRGDRYFGGGAWYPTTLAAAGIWYRLAAAPGQDRAALIARGDAFMATVRDLTPADGAMSEQVDRATGAHTSARNLAWSHAAFLGTARLRAQAQRQRELESAPP